MRSLEALRRHFEIEAELADRLRAASREERKNLYRDVYNELFARVPDHPQHTVKFEESQQAQKLTLQLKLLQPFLTHSDTYLEVGAGDCLLARSAARFVKQVYAVDVSEVITRNAGWPKNFALKLSDGISIPVPSGSVNVAYSNQLMEHLHPDDAVEQLREIYRSLAPGGVYICITPHRFSGPHDISGYFGNSPQGFHLKEYSHGDLRQILLEAGFAAATSWGGLKGRFFPLPGQLVAGLESALSRFPDARRRSLAKSFPLRAFLGDTIIVGKKHKTPQPG